LIPEHSRDQPYSHQVMRDMRQVTDTFGDRVLLGELYAPIDQVTTFYGEARCPELHLPLNMGFAWLPWTADAVGSAIEDYCRHLPPHGWPVWVLSGHDTARLASRTQGEQTRIAVMLLATLRGTPIFYYGEEIGMQGVPIPAEVARDPQGRRIGRNRDPERTPMQWNRDPNAGFTSAVPWLPIGADAAAANVADQSANPESLLSLYRRLTDMRRTDAALAEGDFELVSHVEPLVGFWRRHENQRRLVVLNFSGDPQHYDIPGPQAGARILLSTFLDREQEAVERSITLRGQEGVIVAVE